jgi:ABC-type bacteriocin/lantibiotic exporter with double-glycine peptidase domain
MKESKKKLTLGESFAILGKALKISLKTKTIASIIVSILGFPMAFLPMLISLSLKSFSNQVQALYGAGAGLLSTVIGAFLVLSALYIVQLIYNSVRSYYGRSDSMRIQRYMKERILRCTCDVKYKYIENYDDFKDKIRFADTDAGQRVAGSMQTIIVWLQNIITFVSILVVLLGVDVWIVAVLIAACIPAVVLSYLQKDEEYRYKTLWIHESLMACSLFFEATWQNSINEVRFNGVYGFIKKKWREMNDLYIKKKNKMTRKHVLYNSIADIFRNSVYIVILLITASKIFDNPALGIGAFMLVFTMAGQLQEVTSKIFITAAQFVSDIAYMKDFFYLDELEYEKRDSNAKPRENFVIDFKDVSFTYPNTDRTILHDISLHIREGEKVAIVGENGSGKTTFVSLLCGMYEPDSGEISMGGENIHTDLPRTHRTISAVLQDFARYETSIRDNIIISDGRKQATDEALRALTEKTGAWEFIEPQPAQLDEVVGTYSESGNNLSGGQWQKIAITRCAYRDDAKIMVLDEPTAALDPLAEAELYRNFTKLTGDRTTILISHRLGITRLVDRILVFDDGRIVEDGTHQALLAQNGLYAKMYSAQAQWYEG